MAEITYLKLECVKENICITHGNWHMLNYTSVVLF